MDGSTCSKDFASSNNISITKRAIPIAFEVENKVTVVHTHADMPQLANPNILTLDELVTKPHYQIWIYGMTFR